MYSNSPFWPAFWLVFFTVPFQHALLADTIKLAAFDPFQASTLEPETLALASVGVLLLLVASRIRRRRSNEGKWKR